MTATRRRTFLLVACATLTVLLAAGVVADSLVRARIDSSLASLSQKREGVQAAADGGPVLWSLLSGQVGVVLTADVALVEEVIECRTGMEVSASSSPGVLTVGVELDTVRGPVAAAVSLVVQHEGQTWALVPEVVAIGDRSLPATQLLAVLGDRAPALLRGGGIVLPAADKLDITEIALIQGAVQVHVRVPTASRAAARLGEYAFSCQG